MESVAESETTLSKGVVQTNDSLVKFEHAFNASVLLPLLSVSPAAVVLPSQLYLSSFGRLTPLVRPPLGSAWKASDLRPLPRAAWSTMEVFLWEWEGELKVMLEGNELYFEAADVERFAREVQEWVDLLLVS
jgi:hypothetical protein